MARRRDPRRRRASTRNSSVSGSESNATFTYAPTCSSTSVTCRHPELVTQTPEAACEMVPHGRHRDIEQAPNLVVGPAEPVHQHDTDPLTLGEPGEQRGEPGLHLWQPVRWQQRQARRLTT